MRWDVQIHCLDDMSVDDSFPFAVLGTLPNPNPNPDRLGLGLGFGLGLGP